MAALICSCCITSQPERQPFEQQLLSIAQRPVGWLGIPLVQGGLGRLRLDSCRCLRSAGLRGLPLAVWLVTRVAGPHVPHPPGGWPGPVCLAARRIPREGEQKPVWRHRPRIRPGTHPLLLYSVGQSESPGFIQRESTRLHLLMGGGAEWHCRGEWGTGWHGGCCSFCNLPPCL